jgi:hypothetical protein
MRTLDWNQKQEYARTLSEASLRFAQQDCIEAARAAFRTENEGYYHDEASVYRAELVRRGLEC